MVSNLDIWRAANQLIREHGAPALISKQDARMFDRGDDEGRLVWDADQARDRGATASCAQQATLRLSPLALALKTLSGAGTKSTHAKGGHGFGCWPFPVDQIPPWNGSSCPIAVIPMRSSA
jgi:hypothetical protein